MVTGKKELLCILQEIGGYMNQARNGIGKLHHIGLRLPEKTRKLCIAMAKRENKSMNFFLNDLIENYLRGGMQTLQK